MSASGAAMKWSPTGASMAGLAGGALSSLYNQPNYINAANPYVNSADDDLENYYNKSVGYLQPYNQAGQQGLNNLSSQTTAMSNPTQFYNNTMNGFAMTPAQQQVQRLGLEGVSNNAAMNGTMGSGNEAKNLETYAADNTSDMQQRYFQNVMGINNQAMQGNQALSGLGLNAAGQMGQYGMETGQNLAMMRAMMANLAVNQQQAQNQSTDNGIGALSTLAGGALL